MRTQKGRGVTDSELLEELQRIARSVGRKDLIIDDINEHSVFGENIFTDRFGTFRAALLKAGLEVRPQSRRYTDEECYENLYNVWVHYARKPALREMNLPPSKVGSEAYLIRFEHKWSMAIQAFLTRVNQDIRPIDATISREDLLTSEPSVTVIEAQSERVRTIRLGVRFEVLKRDHFKCVLCGDHPAKDPNCSLHVDHIFPWSKGGKAQIENLRTLCSQCNIGRGNRYDD